MAIAHDPSSYRDPSGFIFEKDGVLYRQVNQSFREHYRHFIDSGCYTSFVKKGWLIPHKEIEQNLTGDADWFLTIQPERLSLVTYPGEWSFDMLRDAALLTLQLVKEAISFGLILKDATPLNIQWHNGRLVFIDTLSFELYNPEKPWIAYRQFCECFAAPLLLMHYRKQPLQQLYLAYPEGIPLQIAKALLPPKSRFNIHTYLHIHLHARFDKKNNTATASAKGGFSKHKMLNLVSSLESLVTQCKLPEQDSTWSGYYDEAATRTGYLEQKQKIITGWLQQLSGVHTVADLGANDGVFSKLAAGLGKQVWAADQDPYCINRLYKQVLEQKDKNIQPMIIELANPTPASGVNNTERKSFITRCQPDLVMALALIHHLAIGKNIPFSLIAAFFAGLSNYLLIEFVPKEDEKVQLLLAHKEDIYPGYHLHAFEESFGTLFTIEQKEPVTGSKRWLYLLKRKKSHG